MPQILNNSRMMAAMQHLSGKMYAENDPEFMKLMGLKKRLGLDTLEAKHIMEQGGTSRKYGDSDIGFVTYGHDYDGDRRDRNGEHYANASVTDPDGNLVQGAHKDIAIEEMNHKMSTYPLTLQAVAPLAYEPLLEADRQVIPAERLTNEQIGRLLPRPYIGEEKGRSLDFDRDVNDAMKAQGFGIDTANQIKKYLAKARYGGYKLTGIDSVKGEDLNSALSINDDSLSNLSIGEKNQIAKFLKKARYGVHKLSGIDSVKGEK